jgi:hypothetical protein
LRRVFQKIPLNTFTCQWLHLFSFTGFSFTSISFQDYSPQFDQNIDEDHKTIHHADPGLFFLQRVSNSEVVLRSTNEQSKRVKNHTLSLIWATYMYLVCVCVGQ